MKVSNYDWIRNEFSLIKPEDFNEENRNVFNNSFIKDALLFCGSRGSQQAKEVKKKKFPF